MAVSSDKCGGFSLVELLVALGVLTIISAALVFAFNFNKSKGEVVMQIAASVREATQRFEVDTGCAPARIDALWDRTVVASPFSNTCYENLSSVWNGPYMKSLGSGLLARIPNISPNAWMYLYSYSTSGGTGSLMWFYLTPSITTQAMKECGTASNPWTGSGCSRFGPYLIVSW